MKENEGHLFADVAGQPFQSYCVKCGIVVDWMKVRNEGTTVPKCTHEYQSIAEQRSVPNLIDDYCWKDFLDSIEQGQKRYDYPPPCYTVERWTPTPKIVLQWQEQKRLKERLKDEWAEFLRLQGLPRKKEDKYGNSK